MCIFWYTIPVPIRSNLTLGQTPIKPFVYCRGLLRVYSESAFENLRPFGVYFWFTRGLLLGSTALRYEADLFFLSYYLTASDIRSLNIPKHVALQSEVFLIGVYY